MMGETQQTKDHHFEIEVKQNEYHTIFSKVLCAIWKCFPFVNIFNIHVFFFRLNEYFGKSEDRIIFMNLTFLVRIHFILNLVGCILLYVPIENISFTCILPTKNSKFRTYCLRASRDLYYARFNVTSNGPPHLVAL